MHAFSDPDVFWFNIIMWPCRTAFYGQYQCYGEGSKTDGRVAWSHQLTQAEAAPFITKVWVGGQEWLR
jgi:pectinesterase